MGSLTHSEPPSKHDLVQRTTTPHLDAGLQPQPPRSLYHFAKVCCCLILPADLRNAGVTQPFFFFVLTSASYGKKSTVAWLLARYIVSPFKNDLASYLPYVAKLFKRSSVILCCATVFVSATGSSDVVVNRETVE